MLTLLKEILWTKGGIISLSAVVLFAVVQIGGCKEDRLQAKIDKLEGERDQLLVDVRLAVTRATVAEGGREVLEEAFRELREKAVADSAQAAVRERRARGIAHSLRDSLQRMAQRAVRDTTDWSWRDLYF